MSAKDVYHAAVKNALQKDGWAITHDPLRIVFLDAELRADLGVEKSPSLQFYDELAFSTVISN